MNKVVGLLTLCVACAVLRAAVVALIVALMLALLWSSIRQPRETLLLLCALALLGLANARPLACIVALGGIAVVGLVAGARRTRVEPLRLTDGRKRDANQH